MASKTLKYPMTVTTEDYDPAKGTGHSETFEVGDAVPSWATKYVEDEWVVENEYGTAGGTDLVSDHTRAELMRAAERLGMDVNKSLSNDQVAAMIRHKLFDDEMEAEYGEDYKDESTSYADTEKLFVESNKAGNVNAPDEAEKKPSRSSGSDG